MATGHVSRVMCHRNTVCPWSWRLILFCCLMISSSCSRCCRWSCLAILKASSSACLGLLPEDRETEDNSDSLSRLLMELNCNNCCCNVGCDRGGLGGAGGLPAPLLRSRSISACIETISVSGSSLRNWEMANLWISFRLLRNCLKA